MAKEGFFQRLRQGLSKSRGNLTNRVDDLVAASVQVDDDFFEELTDILVMADTGVATAEELVGRLREETKRERIRSATEARELFKGILVDHMNIPRPPLR